MTVLTLYDYGGALIATHTVSVGDFPLRAQIRLGELGNINDTGSVVTTTALFRNVHVGKGSWGANEIFDDAFASHGGAVSAAFSPWDGFEDLEQPGNSVTTAAISSSVLDVTSVVQPFYAADFSYATLEKDALSIVEPVYNTDVYFTWDINDGGNDPFAGEPLALGDTLLRGFNLFLADDSHAFTFFVDAPLYDGMLTGWTTWGYRLHINTGVEPPASTGLHVWQRFS